MPSLSMSAPLRRSCRRLAPWAALAVASVVGLARAAGVVDEGEGEVKKVDVAQAKVTVRHSGLAKLDVPPMTLVFRVQPPELLDGMAVGDRIEFKVEKQGGQYLITQWNKWR